MSRPEQERLLDILAACEAIASHLDRESLDDDVRRSRSGGAVKDPSGETHDQEPSIP